MSMMQVTVAQILRITAMLMTHNSYVNAMHAYICRAVSKGDPNAGVNMMSCRRLCIRGVIMLRVMSNPCMNYAYTLAFLYINITRMHALPPIFKHLPTIITVVHIYLLANFTNNFPIRFAYKIETQTNIFFIYKFG